MSDANTHRTAAATAARKLKPGEQSLRYSIRGPQEMHEWLATLKPSEIAFHLYAGYKRDQELAGKKVP